MGTVSSTYVKKTGDTMTGNLVVGSSSIGTNGYIEGTWLKTTANISSDRAGNFAIVRDGGWIYSRTPAQARQDMGLSTAMHFIGKATVDITDGSTVDPKITGYTTKTAGDVIIDKNNSYEYVWTLEGKWERLGPDGSYSVIGHNHDDRYSTAISITIPKGRMRGDVDGDGKITHDDITQIRSHAAGNITLTGADFWCADVNKSNSVNTTDVLIINQYLKGNRSVLTSTPTFADYYNNWTYVKVDDLTGYWTIEIPIAGLTTSNNVVVNICETFSMGQFYKVEVLDGKIKIYANRPPINDIPAIVVISSGSGKGSIPSYLDDSSLDYKFSLSLPTDSWTGSDPYTQTVTIPNSTANTKVDIQPSEEIYDQLVADNVGYLAIKNVNGTLTAVAKGGKPSVDLTVQVTYNNVY